MKIAHCKKNYYYSEDTKGDQSYHIFLRNIPVNFIMCFTNICPNVLAKSKITLLLLSCPQIRYNFKWLHILSVLILLYVVGKDNKQNGNELLNPSEISILIYQRESDCCLTSSEESCIYMMARTGCNSTSSWWWYTLWSRQTYLVGFSASSPKQQSVGRHVAPIRHII